MATKAQELKRDMQNAAEYIAKIGKSGHGRAGSLHGVSVETQIYHQANAGDTNYWDDKEFDAALSVVVNAQFKDLAAMAIEVMQEKYRLARIAEKEALLASLAEIEALENEA